MARRRTMAMIGAVALASVFLFTVADVQESDAAGIPEYYCYTYDLSFTYSGGSVIEIQVDWSAVGTTPSGEKVEIGIIEPLPSKDNGWSVYFDPDDVSRCKELLVTQKVTNPEEPMIPPDILTWRVIIVEPLPEGESYTINMYDGNKLYYTMVIDAFSYAEVGKNVVNLPLDPVREGYLFMGWFTDINFTHRFDPTLPVTSDIDLYAKWAYTGGSTVDPDNPLMPDPSAVITQLDVSGNFRTSYRVGDDLNTTGMAVYALYSDGIRLEVTSQCTFTPSHFTQVGQIKVDVHYQTVSSAFNVEVTEPFSPDDPVNPDDPGGDTPDGTKPSEPDGGVEKDITDYLLVVVGVLLAVLIVVVLYRTKH